MSWIRIGKIDGTRLDNKMTVSRLHALVRNDDGVIFGLLLTYIDCERVILTCAVHPGTPIALSKRFATLIRETVGQLHDADIV